MGWETLIRRLRRHLPPEGEGYEWELRRHLPPEGEGYEWELRRHLPRSRGRL